MNELMSNMVLRDASASKKNGRSITCISLTSSLYWDLTKLTCPLKAQQTPVSVITGVKISEQFTLKKALIEF